MKLILNNIFFTFPKVLQTHITVSYNKLISIEVSCYMSEPLLELNGNILDQIGGNTILHILS